MTRIVRGLLLGACFLWTACGAGPQHSISPASRGHESPLSSPPPARRVDAYVELFGERIADPYRWLEDENSDGTRAWLTAQERYTRAFLGAVPRRDAIERRVTELNETDFFSPPLVRGGRYYFTHRAGGQPQPVFRVADSSNGLGRVVLDPQALAEDGTVSVPVWSYSDDGRYLAYGVSVAGSERVVLRVIEVETGRELGEQLEGLSVFSRVAWHPDGSGFWYDRSPRAASNAHPEVRPALRFHVLGDTQSKDRVVYAPPVEPEWYYAAQVTHDHEYVLLVSWWRYKTAYSFRRLDDDGDFAPLVPRPDAIYRFVGNDGPQFWFLTTKDAPNGRLLMIDGRSPDPAGWIDLIAESDDPLVNVVRVGDHLVTVYMRDAHHEVELRRLDGSLERAIEMPSLGSVGDITVDDDERGFFFSFWSFTRPPTVYRYDLDEDELRIWRAPRLTYDPGAYVTERVRYTSRDGTEIPMFVSHRVGVSRDGNAPTVLYGYGAFGSTLSPWFAARHLAWMELGGIVAMPNIRGGNVYGRTWHDAGSRRKKQNGLDDFIAAAQWLVDNHYTRPQRLAASGVSAGGLLVGACVNQRPDLFGASLPSVGVLDLLRMFEMGDSRAFVAEWGDPEILEDFRVLRRISPYHNIQPGVAYPATLVLAAEADQRVHPSHSYKYVAALQAAQSGPNPVLLRLEREAGHGGRASSQVIAEATDRLTFLVHVFGLTVPDTW